MVVDTSLIIEHVRSKNKLNTTLYQISNQPDLFVSAITIYELYMGVKSKTMDDDIKLVLSNLTVLPFSNEVALKAAEIYHDLKKQNKLIEFRDIFIAATCIVNELPIATLNKKHFQRIEGLIIA
ncbi:type II toxin-antitoxin system VapC family toxin [Mucilaginibacter psychrotolerans]|uniref:Type II toxin-antitoxin system VapC family toxin n=1 Tax=Mucilaginibacter psychrotolerans TaxID=1524096 RepID=A0A4Y8SMV9_9SPHI|nr:type II toxin-antitoxin system VapC family toxin [Mucilaginibacter psychrotolerans]TFF40065.1 type II toxin-antitoxin system VapC family toxin [Mucilaginibacter psychrotolerans]